MSIITTSIFMISIVIFTNGISETQAQSSETSKLEDYFHKKCTENTAGFEGFNKLRTDTYDLGQYMEHSFSFLPNQISEFCDKERKILSSKMKDVAKDLVQCLPEKEMFLANFFREAFGEFLHFLCHDNGANTRRLFSQRSTNCNVGDLNTKIGTCFDNVFVKGKGFITKSQMCENVVVTKRCFARILENDCPNSSDLKDLNEKLFNYVNKPCSACTNYLGLLVLMLCVIFNFVLK